MFTPRLITALASIHFSSAAVLQPVQSFAQANSATVPALSAEVLNQETANVSLLVLPPTSTPDEWNSTSLPPTNLTVPNRVNYLCNGTLFGRDLDPRSCLNAWSKIPAIERELSFGPRRTTYSSPTYDVYLPKRYLSSDGTCAIAPLLRPRVVSARAKPTDAGLAALQIIRRCASDGVPPTGGLAKDFGGDNNLAVIVRLFKPEVNCYGSSVERFPESCNSLADDMRVTLAENSFGYHGTDPQYQLPYEWKSTDRLCNARISGRGDEVNKESWYKFWEAVVAINAMCIPNGQAGYWDGLGDKGELGIQVWTERPWSTSSYGNVTLGSTSR